MELLTPVAKAFEAAGVSVARTKPPATALRPLGHLRSFLEDVRARGLTPGHIVDVGAHKADWSWVAHAVWPRARFTLIEPQVELQPYLERFARQVPGSRWLEAGAADAPGELTLTLNPDPASSTLAFTDEEAREAGLAARRVPVITLDSLLVGEHPPELVKIDAEQLELRVLRGAERHFGRTELFVVEVSLFKWEGSTSTFVEVVEFMRDHGYVPYDFCGFQRRPLDGALALTDVAFAREHGLLRSQASWA